MAGTRVAAGFVRFAGSAGLAGLAALLLAPMAVMAQTAATSATTTPAVQPPPPLTAQVQAGYVDAHGTNDTQTANAKIAATYSVDKWKHTLGLDGVYGKQNDIVTAEQLDANWQSDYNFTGDFFVFGALVYNDDKFSGFQYQESATTGIGYSLIKTKDVTLDVQIGAGYGRLRPELLIKNAAGDVIGRVPLDTNAGLVETSTISGSYAFNASTKLMETFFVQSGDGNTQMQDNIGVQVNMSKVLALSVAYEIQHNTSPPAGLPKSNTLGTVNLVYTLK